MDVSDILREIRVSLINFNYNMQSRFMIFREKYTAPIAYHQSDDDVIAQNSRVMDKI